MSESLLSPYHHHHGLYRYDNVYLPRFPLFSLILSSEVAAQDHSDGLSDSGVESEGSELDYTSLDGMSYIEQLNSIGWSSEDVFLQFLRSAYYAFSERSDGRIFCKKGPERVAPALAVLIFEQ